MQAFCHQCKLCSSGRGQGLPTIYPQFAGAEPAVALIRLRTFPSDPSTHLHGPFGDSTSPRPSYTEVREAAARIWHVLPGVPLAVGVLLLLTHLDHRPAPQKPSLVSACRYLGGGELPSSTGELGSVASFGRPFR